MARELKTNGIYKVKCTLTGEPAGTTPAVFQARAERYGIDTETLKDNYIGRTGAKLLTTMVNDNGIDTVQAIKQIRTEFGVTSSSKVDETVIEKVLTKVSAKAKKARETAEFETRKAAALAKLLAKPQDADEQPAE